MRLSQIKCVLPFVVLAVLSALTARAAETQARDRQLQQSLNDTHVHSSWIYNDLDAGFVEAKRTGKPLLIVFR